MRFDVENIRNVELLLTADKHLGNLSFRYF